MIAAAVLVVSLVGGPELAAGDVLELPGACPAVPPLVLVMPTPAPAAPVDLAPVLAELARLESKVDHVDAEAAAFRDELRSVWKSLVKQLPVILPIIGGVLAGRATK